MDVLCANRIPGQAQNYETVYPYCELTVDESRALRRQRCRFLMISVPTPIICWRAAMPFLVCLIIFVGVFMRCMILL